VEDVGRVEHAGDEKYLQNIGRKSWRWNTENIKEEMYKDENYIIRFSTLSVDFLNTGRNFRVPRNLEKNYEHCKSFPAPYEVKLF
jgi:hypothetical protein